MTKRMSYFKQLALVFALAAEVLLQAQGFGLAQEEPNIEENPDTQETSGVQEAEPSGELVETDASQSADWRDQIGVLLIGYLQQGEASFQREKMEPFRRLLEEKTGLEVIMRPHRKWGELIDQQADRRLQYVIHSAATYATTMALCKCVEPLAVPTSSGGSKGVYSLLLVPGNSSISSLSGLKGQRVAISQAPSVAGRSIILSQLEKMTAEDPSFRPTFVQARNPIEAAQMMLEGKADAAVGWSSLMGDQGSGYSKGTLRALIESGVVASGQLRIAWQSALLPYGPHAIRVDVPTELKEILRETLQAMNEQYPDAYDAISGPLEGGFRAIENAEYQPLLNIAQTSK